MTLDGPPERVFPLLCPVREYDWIDGWACEIVYAETGKAEPGGIFTTRSPDAGEEVWTISRYDPPRAIEFVRVAAHVWVVTLAFALEPAGTARTTARVRHTYTALTGADALAVEKTTQQRQEAWARNLERLANHYLTTGQMLRQPDHAPS
jgi:hypothetical protein